jgi:hypothetical protein
MVFRISLMIGQYAKAVVMIGSHQFPSLRLH